VVIFQSRCCRAFEQDDLEPVSDIADETYPTEIDNVFTLLPLKIIIMHLINPTKHNLSMSFTRIVDAFTLELDFKQETVNSTPITNIKATAMLYLFAEIH